MASEVGLKSFVEVKDSDGRTQHGIFLEAKESDPGFLTHWVDFRIIEAYSCDEYGAAVSWEDSDYRPVDDPFDADHWCKGHVRWDGCCEMDVSFHACGERDFDWYVTAMKYAIQMSEKIYECPREDWPGLEDPDPGFVGE